jgi:PAS domain S-box-containing protein
MFIPPLLLCVAGCTATLGLFVLRARPHSGVHRWFAGFSLAAATWSLAIALLTLDAFAEVALRLAFASVSLALPALLSFAYCYPCRPHLFPKLAIRFSLAIGGVFAVLSLFTPFIAYDAHVTTGGYTRKTGALYLSYAVYCVSTLVCALLLMIIKWYHARGLARVQLQYVLVGAGLTAAGGTTTNLLLPLMTGRSTYGPFGPLFLLSFVTLVAHAIIRHHLMNLRLILHRSLIVATATIISLLPVGLVLFVFGKRIETHFEAGEVAILLASIVAATLLVPPVRDVTSRLLDRYAYRTHTDFQQAVRNASRRLTELLDLRSLASFITSVVAGSIESEGVALYLTFDSTLVRIRSHVSHDASRFTAPDVIDDLFLRELNTRNDLLLVEVLAREQTDQSRQLQREFEKLDWALALPLLSEHKVIGTIVVGPKLSGDPFYPQDLDLLMTLATQAATAIKNAQLYTEVVLANEYIENTVATIESGVVAIDAGGRIAMFNRAAEQLTGLRAEDLKRQPVERLPAELVAPLRTTISDGQGQVHPEIALPDGTTTRPVICTTSPLRDPAGAILGAVAVFSDLTPLKELERERRRAERLAYFEILASSLAHEIKNPLVAIKTFAQLIPRRRGDEQFVEEFSRVVTREIGRMERLIERLRALSRPGEQPKRSIDMREPLQHALDLLRPAFDEKRITLDVTLGSGPGLVVGDPNELEQLFLNLLINAHEATPPDGTVAVDLSTTAEQVCVTIADSGPGVPPDLFEHVFDPFITTKPRGSGLGLTISAGIARTHQATLRADNRPDGGARFTVVFPVATPPVSRTEVRGTGINGMNTRG